MTTRLARPLVVLAAVLGSAALLLVLAAVPARAAIEDYAPYQPQSRCAPKAKPGTKELGRWIVKRYGGGFGGISRECGSGTSEHYEGRAFDWTVDARKRSDRRKVRRFLGDLFATDGSGNTHARARRMGIMYVIWDDRIYSAWHAFDPRRYKSAGCKKVKSCSATLRHRDHVHVSITRKAARGKTSWYDG